MPELYTPTFIHDYDIELTQTEDWVLGFRCFPESIAGLLYLEDTTGYSGQLTVRAPDQDGPIVLEVSTTSGAIQVGFTPPIWHASTVYGLGQRVVPPTLNGFMYECVVAGTSHSSQPMWPTTIGDTEPDNTASWNCIATDATVCNVFIFIDNSVTGALVPWGRGVYSLSVKDTFNHSWFYVDGAAFLRPSSVQAAG